QLFTHIYQLKLIPPTGYNNIFKPFIFNGFLDTTKMKAPFFLMILTGTTKYAIRREDGVYVIPIGCLKD
ncbi:hypothetical protein, partial [Hallella sp.]|uniref:hypothetical protein n=1 Tax=Hallella sp. TaxID=2980186 RepID=UPI003078A7A9